MKGLKILIVMLVLIMSVGAVCAAENITDDAMGDDSKEILETVHEDITTDDSSDILKTTQNDLCTASEDSFTNLTDEIARNDVVDLSHDYKFNNETDNSSGILISKDNFVLNGNGRTIDANNQSRIFNITANNVTLSNLILKNGNANDGGAVYTKGTVTLNNVTFINNYATNQGGAVALLFDNVLNINNSKFIDNYAKFGPSISVQKGNLSLYNTEFTSNVHVKSGQVNLNEGIGYIDNATFANIVSDYTPAIQVGKLKSLTVLNSKFINLTAKITAGAISVKSGGVIYIRNCEFTNTTSSKNAGAIIADISGYDNLFPGNVTILDTVFRDTSSGFGGAYIQFGGKLLINNTEFINNHATYNGGSVYISYVDYAEVNGCNFTSNGVDIIEGYPTYGGAMVIDMSTITINNSRFVNNTASAGNAIYAYDASYTIKNSLFENNTDGIYTFFDKKSSLENITLINDNISLNNTFYATIQIGEGMRLTLLNNTINVDTIPKRFDLRDWGWVSPVRDQGWMGACWTFGMTGTLESALLKATGIAADLSENNMQDTMLQYSIYGITSIIEGGGNIASVAYLLSWLGAFIQDADTYDEFGKISPLITTLNDIHIQDVMFTPNNEIPNGTQLKLAIMKYGSIDVSYNGQSTYNEVTPYYNPKTYAQYVNDSSIQPNHAVSIVGWDDNFPKEKFGITPPGDGAWIVKNSWGTDWGDNGFLYVSYYDKTLLMSSTVVSYATSIIIENTVPYNKNYQYDIAWGGDFVGNGTVRYMNVFEALDDDLIAAVGTFFNQSGINYAVEIYVNDELKLTQDGVSPYYGYHTIKLDEYIPIKKGDVFKAVITSNGMPRIELKDTRVHYTNNISFISFNGTTWQDAYDLGYIACLKVYTVADDCIIIDNVDMEVDYRSDSYFTVKVVTADGHAVGAGIAVNFTINEKTTTVLTDEDGIAKIKITETPDTYTMTTTLNGKDYTNTITVKLVPTPAMTFKELEETIKNSTKNYLDLYDDYEFNNETDNKLGILIDRDNFVINGNGHTIDGKNQSRIFNITANNVTLSNVILKNGNADKGGAIYATGSLTLNNVTFSDNCATERGGAVGLYGDVTLNCNNSQFTDNYAEAGSSIFVEKGKLNICNTDLSSKVFNKYSQIVAFKNSVINVENVTFINSSSSYATALFFKSVKSAIIKNSKFINLKANLTAGAIGLRNGGELYIENCEFTNTTSTNNGGAVFVDIIGEFEDTGNVTLINSVFRDTYSGFGGAYVQLGGKLLLSNSKFINSHAKYNGGAIYLSYTDTEISNSNFTSNGIELNDQDYPTYGGAVFSDMSTLNINNVRFINNTASAGSAIYAYDTSYNIKNSLFENNTNPIYTVFDKESLLENNIYINDENISLNNTYFATIMATQSLQLTLLNNTINVTVLPAKFDLRDWGWISPVKNQGWIGACWTFGMTSALESSLLKATGILADLSENSMRNAMLRYSIWGSKDLYEGAYNMASVAYLISWLGAFVEDVNPFDEMGKISPLMSTLQDIHVQDAIFIPNEIPDSTQMKEAIMKSGALDVVYFGQSTFDQENPYFNPKTNAQYVNVSTPSNHEVSVVGWDDNYPKENFLITPPGDGAWIVKNSWGADWGDNGYLYVSYYDKSFAVSTALTEYATAIIFENTVQYNKNYQYDITWAGSFSSGEGNMSYLNQYLAQDDDLIAAVGTYFNQANVNYKVEIYVNDELKLTQEGISPFYGYHTIKLDSYIPIKKGDVFKAKITSNAIPFIRIADERVHYTENISFISDGVNWEDAYNNGIIACLKVYTVADDTKIINNNDITVDYGSGSYFTVQVVTADGHAVGAGAPVKFTINGKTTAAFTDANGIAKFEITNVPGTYEVTTTYNNQTYKNSVVVNLNPSTCKITQNKNIKVDYDGGKYFSVKIASQNGKVAASGVSVKFTINKKTTTVKTDKNGIAKIKITDVPKKYTITTTFNGKSVKNTVTVKQVLKTKKVTVKKTAKKFTLKATLKINGKKVKGKVIKFKFKGKTYKAKTNKKGIAKVTIKKKVIKKLKKGKKYTVKITYKKDTIKTTVKVKK